MPKMLSKHSRNKCIHRGRRYAMLIKYCICLAHWNRVLVCSVLGFGTVSRGTSTKFCRSWFKTAKLKITDTVYNPQDPLRISLMVRVRQVKHLVRVRNLDYGKIKDTATKKFNVHCRSVTRCKIQSGAWKSDALHVLLFCGKGITFSSFF